MKKISALVFLALCLAESVPSFGAEHMVSRSAKVVAKDTYSGAKYSVKEAGKATKSFVKFVI
jgi:hypothetical protein